jgi:hypothetical protein
MLSTDFFNKIVNQHNLAIHHNTGGNAAIRHLQSNFSFFLKLK